MTYENGIWGNAIVGYHNFETQLEGYNPFLGK
jgi:hypothetical protein